MFSLAPHEGGVSCQASSCKRQQKWNGGSCNDPPSRFQAPSFGGLMVSHPLLQVIHDYTEAVRAGRVAYAGTICPRCEAIPDTFKIHERRQRTFRVVIERLVHRGSGLVV